MSAASESTARALKCRGRWAPWLSESELIKGNSSVPAVLLALPMTWHEDKSLLLCESVACVCIMIGLAWVIAESLLSTNLYVYNLAGESLDESTNRLEELSWAQHHQSTQIVP